MATATGSWTSSASATTVTIPEEELRSVVVCCSKSWRPSDALIRTAVLTCASLPLVVRHTATPLHEWNDGIFRGALGDMSGSLTGGKAGGVEQLLGGLLGNNAPVGTSSTALLRMTMTRVPHNGGIGGFV